MYENQPGSRTPADIRQIFGTDCDNLKQGGYYLTKEPSDYTVGMILRLTEGSLAPVACMEDELNQCIRSGHCATLTVWKQLDQAINGVVDNITLADLVEEQKKLDGDFHDS